MYPIFLQRFDFNDRHLGTLRVRRTLLKSCFKLKRSGRMQKERRYGKLYGSVERAEPGEDAHRPGEQLKCVSRHVCEEED